MKSCDVIGYAHQDGFVLCDECGRDLDGTGGEVPVQPIFADELPGLVGYGCDRCGRVLTGDGDWDEPGLRPGVGELDWDDDIDARSALASAGWGTDEDYGTFGDYE